MHYYNAHHGVMEPSTPHRVSVNIGEMVRKHLVIVPSLIEAHSLIGGDAVVAFSGI